MTGTVLTEGLSETSWNYQEPRQDKTCKHPTVRLVPLVKPCQRSWVHPSLCQTCLPTAQALHLARDRPLDRIARSSLLRAHERASRWRLGWKWSWREIQGDSPLEIPTTVCRCRRIDSENAWWLETSVACFMIC